MISDEFRPPESLINKPVDCDDVGEFILMTLLVKVPLILTSLKNMEGDAQVKL